MPLGEPWEANGAAAEQAWEVALETGPGSVGEGHGQGGGVTPPDARPDADDAFAFHFQVVPVSAFAFVV